MLWAARVSLCGHDMIGFIVFKQCTVASARPDGGGSGGESGMAAASSSSRGADRAGCVTVFFKKWSAQLRTADEPLSIDMFL